MSTRTLGDVQVVGRWRASKEDSEVVVWEVLERQLNGVNKGIKRSNDFRKGVIHSVNC